ncbi:MAG: glycosyltransferase, partial [Planctomycetaceae bacterium]|nr:glycosyltransferase [Planctomycetaceae bacterium]
MHRRCRFQLSGSAGVIESLRRSLMRVSVIIPTLNESSQIAACIQSCRDANCHEVIVVDAGSNDDTISLVGQADKIISS